MRSVSASPMLPIPRTSTTTGPRTSTTIIQYADLPRFRPPLHAHSEEGVLLVRISLSQDAQLYAPTSSHRRPVALPSGLRLPADLLPPPTQSTGPPRRNGEALPAPAAPAILRRYRDDSRTASGPASPRAPEAPPSRKPNRFSCAPNQTRIFFFLFFSFPQPCGTTAKPLSASAGSMSNKMLEEAIHRAPALESLSRLGMTAGA